MCNCFILLKIIKDEEVCRTSKESLAKNNKKYSKRSAVWFEEISCDQSEGQVSPHNRIVTYINKFGQDTFQRIYTKQELTRLSGAYGVETTSRTNKTTMATTLVPVIRSCSSVPNPYVLNNYRILATLMTTQD